MGAGGLPRMLAATVGFIIIPLVAAFLAIWHAVDHDAVDSISISLLVVGLLPGLAMSGSRIRFGKLLEWNRFEGVDDKTRKKRAEDWAEDVLTDATGSKVAGLGYADLLRIETQEIERVARELGIASRDLTRPAKFGDVFFDAVHDGGQVATLIEVFVVAKAGDEDAMQRRLRQLTARASAVRDKLGKPVELVFVPVRLEAGTVKPKDFAAAATALRDRVAVADPSLVVQVLPHL